MRIGDLAEQTGTSTRQLRYYEQQGLLHSERGGNGYRDYDAHAIERVEQIRTLLEGGFSTALIAELLPCVQGADADLPPTRNPEMAARLESEIARMGRMIDALEHSRSRFACYLQRVQ